jgi:hypothetical protein
MPPTPMPIQMKVIAYIARGDEYTQIQAQIKEEFDRDLAMPTITAIKRRNLEALSIIKSSVIKEEAITAKKLLEQSRALIGTKLTRAEKDAMYLEDQESLFRRGKISLKEYKANIATTHLPTLTELTSVSKEMHHQDEAASQTNNDASKPENAADVWKMLKEGDDIELQRMVFGKKEEEQTVVKLEKS